MLQAHLPHQSCNPRNVKLLLLLLLLLLHQLRTNISRVPLVRFPPNFQVP